MDSSSIPENIKVSSARKRANAKKKEEMNKSAKKKMERRHDAARRPLSLPAALRGGATVVLHRLRHQRAAVKRAHGHRFAE